MQKNEHTAKSRKRFISCSRKVFYLIICGIRWVIFYMLYTGTIHRFEWNHNCCCPTFPGLLSEEQCKARDVRRKQKSTKIRKSETNSPETPPGIIERSDSEDCKEKIKSKVNVKAETIIDEEPLNKVGDDTKKLVEKVVFLQDKYEFADENVLKTINVSIWHHFFPLLTLYLKLYMSFTLWSKN